MLVRIINKFQQRFIEKEKLAGLIMLILTVIAIFLVNSDFKDIYQQVISAKLIIGINKIHHISFEIIINDILMVIFFLVVGLELKREICEGFLSKKNQILLPFVAALSGMIVPMLIFYLINLNHPQNLRGSAIPSATDIAFALNILLLVSKRLPNSLKIFLLAIAVFDDIGAIIIIALFYSSQFSLNGMLLALGCIIILYLLNRSNITNLTPYILSCGALAYFLHQTGIHSTIAGVITGLALPMRDKKQLSHSPINSCLHFIHPFVSFLVLPIFAFFNAGVEFSNLSLKELFNPLTLGVMLGLFFGKQIGIYGTVIGLWKLKLVDLPENSRKIEIYGVSVLAGIGFTMSLFIGMLAFNDNKLIEKVKIGVLSGSLLSAILGLLILLIATRKNESRYI